MAANAMERGWPVALLASCTSPAHHPQPRRDDRLHRASAEATAPAPNPRATSTSAISISTRAIRSTPISSMFARRLRHAYGYAKGRHDPARDGGSTCASRSGPLDFLGSHGPRRVSRRGFHAIDTPGTAYSKVPYARELFSTASANTVLAAFARFADSLSSGKRLARARERFRDLQSAWRRHDAQRRTQQRTRQVHEPSSGTSTRRCRKCGTSTAMSSSRAARRRRCPIPHSTPRIGRSVALAGSPPCGRTSKRSPSHTIPTARTARCSSARCGTAARSIAPTRSCALATGAARRDHAGEGPVRDDAAALAQRRARRLRADDVLYRHQRSRSRSSQAATCATR